MTWFWEFTTSDNHNKSVVVQQSITKHIIIIGFNLILTCQTKKRRHTSPSLIQATMVHSMSAYLFCSAVSRNACFPIKNSTIPPNTYITKGLDRQSCTVFTEQFPHTYIINTNILFDCSKLRRFSYFTEVVYGVRERDAHLLGYVQYVPPSRWWCHRSIGRGRHGWDVQTDILCKVDKIHVITRSPLILTR